MDRGPSGHLCCTEGPRNVSEVAIETHSGPRAGITKCPRHEPRTLLRVEVRVRWGLSMYTQKWVWSLSPNPSKG